jgi:competence protein ComEA
MAPAIQTILNEYKIPLFLIVVSVFCFTTGFILFLRGQSPKDAIKFVSSQSSSSANLATISVDIEGAVVHPGMYQLPQGSRVEDILVQAGGYTKDVDKEYSAKVVNRAALLTDGMKLYIPVMNDEQGSTSYNSNCTSSECMTSHNLQNGSVAGAATKLVSVNSASQSELESLSGIGPVTAQKIISARPYMDPHEVVIKKAMSESLFGKLKDELSL